MPDPHVISALEDKAHDLRSAIVSYEEHLERTCQELAFQAWNGETRAKIAPTPAVRNGTQTGGQHRALAHDDRAFAIVCLVLSNAAIDAGVSS